MKDNTIALSTPFMARSAKLLAAVAAACALVACGGGGGSTGDSAYGPGAGTTFGPGSGETPFQPGPGTTFEPTPTPTPITDSGAVAQKCSPSNPYRADASGTTTEGSIATEKLWVRSYMNEAYLWYDEVRNIDAANALYSDDSTTGFYPSIATYFDDLLTPALTGSGKRKDQFSFTYSTKAWNDLAQSGVALGYGIEWTMQSSTPPRNIRIAYIEPGSAAATAGLQRGDTLVSVNGVGADDNTQTGVATLNAGLFPSAAGSFTFVFSRTGSSNITSNLTAAAVSKTPVLMTQVVTAGDGSKVGYIVFNDHVAPAEQQLIDAVNTLKAQGISDLVLDLRYNGGGYIYIASELAYMIAGPTRTETSGAAKVFEKFQYNSKRVADNSADPYPFFNTSCILGGGNQCTNEQPLPTLDLGRVYVLTTGSTCSASESIINGLRGVDVEVNVIGTSTCGKPYGFTAKDNCGISYFPIEFQGVNAKGFGDYADGFAATCAAGDDFTRQLGDVNEAKLATALYMRANANACPPVPLGFSKSALAAAKAGKQLKDASVLRTPARENRIHIDLRR